jgi:hypothetical protein
MNLILILLMDMHSSKLYLLIQAASPTSYLLQPQQRKRLCSDRIVSAHLFLLFLDSNRSEGEPFLEEIRAYQREAQKDQKE